ncbi:MAG: hypothetical protein R3D68_02800 [Hyphomicrobiaceae bacterium]
MTISAIDAVTRHSGLEALPIRFQSRASRAATIARLLLLAPAILLLSLTVTMLAASNADATSAMALIAENPSAAAKATLGLIVWAALFAIPLKRAISRFAARRSVEIDATTVRVSVRGAFGQHSWEAPLSTYTGVAHHVRTSLSGTRHELILVHPQSDKTLLLSTADRISQATIDQATATLGLPEVPARTLYAGGLRAA